MAATIKPALLAEMVKKHGATITCKELMSYGQGVYIAATQGALRKVSRGIYALGGSGEMTVTGTDETTGEQKSVEMTLAEMSSLIDERFRVFDVLTNGIIKRTVTSMVVTGAPGVGKTYTLETRMNQAMARNEIKSFRMVKGSVSAIGLFATLWENRRAGEVLVLDDADEIFEDVETLNLLKSALDSGKKRTISWIKNSSYLKDHEIPNEFDYNGSIVFISNIDMEGIIMKGGKMAPHMGALLSRATFLDLAIHSVPQILLRIEQVLGKSSMLGDLGMSEADGAMLLGWMKDHAAKMRSVSLRTVIQLATFLKTTDDWQAVARATLLRKVF